MAKAEIEVKLTPSPTLIRASDQMGELLAHLADALNDFAVDLRIIATKIEQEVAEMRSANHEGGQDA